MNVTGQGAPAGATYDIAVAKKQLQSVKEQGQQALQLIEAAAPSKATAPGVGARLNLTA